MKFYDDALLEQVTVLSRQISKSFAKDNGFSEQRTIDSKKEKERGMARVLSLLVSITFLFSYRKVS